MKPLLITAMLLLTSCTPSAPSHPQVQPTHAPHQPPVEAEPIPPRKPATTAPDAAPPRDAMDGMNQLQRSVDEMRDRNNDHLRKIEKSRKDMLLTPESMER